MPELPEVEVTAQQLRAQLECACLASSWHSGKALRHPYPKRALEDLQGEALLAVRRRAKFLMLEFKTGWLVIHLGMSGSLRCCDPGALAQLHDHVRLCFALPKGRMREVVLHDPRRFGSLQWVPAKGFASWEQAGQGLSRAGLGFEPFDERLTAQFMHRSARGSRQCIKQWLMNGKVVVGVGNIYACEALFDAGIHPARKAGSIAVQRYENLLVSVRRILSQAIKSGGSTLRDFYQPDGASGNYRQSHQVYGREGEPCPHCGARIRKIVQQQRSTFYCHACQR